MEKGFYREFPDFTLGITVTEAALTWIVFGKLPQGLAL
jgi:hypothetical protein